MLAIWQQSERVQLSGQVCNLAGAGALERVFLPCAWHGYSAERVRLNGCSYHVPGMGTLLSGCIWVHLSERSERAWHRYSAKRVHLNGCSYHVPGMDTALSGRA